MKYIAKFPTISHQKKFEKVLSEIPDVNLREKIMKAVEGLEDHPRPLGRKLF